MPAGHVICFSLALSFDCEIAYVLSQITNPIMLYVTIVIVICSVSSFVIVFTCFPHIDMHLC